MNSPKKSVFDTAKRAFDWLDESDDDPDARLMQAVGKAWKVIAEHPPGAIHVMVLVSDGQGLALARVDGRGVVVEGGKMNPTHWLPLPPLPEPLEPKGPQSIFRHNSVWRRY
ncbi:MAG: hypothetical protein HQL91_07470 [Magnetococcales bacterium]|nr:hypothetical protein [Magnetococcales bacterium]